MARPDVPTRAGKATAPSLRGLRAVLRVGVLLLGELLPAMAAAASTDSPIDEAYTHSSWGQKDGAPGAIGEMALGPDGWLWLGTETGIWRFDGVTFERRDPFGAGNVSSRSVESLYVTGRGDVWVDFDTHRVGVIRATGSPLATMVSGFPEDKRVDQFIEDGAGRLFALGEGEVYLAAAHGFERVDALWGLDGSPISAATRDGGGNLWMATRTGLYRLTQGGTRFVQVSAIGGGRLDLGMNPDGSIWTWSKRDGLVTVPDSRPTSVPRMQTGLHSSFRMVDHTGMFWTVSCPEAVCRTERPAPGALAPPVPDHPSSPLSSPATMGMFEDQEGTIWVGTRAGLDRFRRNDVVKVALPGNPTSFAMALDGDGTVWTGTASLATETNHWWRLSGSPEIVGDFVHNVSVTYTDADGSILLAGIDGTWRFSHGRFSPYAGPPGPFAGRPYGLARDSQKRLWMSYQDTPMWVEDARGWRVNGGISKVSPATPSVMANDSRGRVWLGYVDNAMAIVDGNTVTSFHQVDGLATGKLSALLPDGMPMLAGELGLAAFDGKRVHMIATTHPDAVRGVTGMLRSADGALWLNGNLGAVRIDGADVLRAAGDPRFVAPVRVFGQSAGMPGGAQSVHPTPTLVQDRSGWLWFATTNGIGRLDPKALAAAKQAPPVYVRSLTAHDVTRVATDGIKLPAHTDAVRVAYTTPALGDPDSATFRYRLEGIDDGWQDAGTRREAAYTNLPPGAYRFQVVAAYQGGPWQVEPAQFDFKIAYAFYQRAWFAVACILAALGMSWLAYRRHLRTVRRRLTREISARHAERRRMARHLHDTILQDVQALVLLVHGARNEASDTGQAQLDVALGHAEATLRSGRARIETLRSPGGAPVELQDELGRVVTEMTGRRGPVLALTATGTAWPVRASVADEVAWIVREALSNTLSHAAATRVTVDIAFHWRFVVVTVSDNGQGIDSRILADGGKKGHWGLAGMRERANDIAASFHIGARPGGGTRVTTTLTRFHAAPAGGSRLTRWMGRRFR